jgi:hypothetical protein
LALTADEGRGTLRKAPVRGVHPLQPEMSEWGNPHRGMPVYLRGEHIASRKGTWGTETSQYPEEKKRFSE